MEQLQVVSSDDNHFEYYKKDLLDDNNITRRQFIFIGKSSFKRKDSQFGLRKAYNTNVENLKVVIFFEILPKVEFMFFSPS